MTRSGTYPKTAICDQCHKEYVVKMDHRGVVAAQKHRFCSRACFIAWMKREKESDTKVTLTCAWCGKEFRVIPSLAKRGKRFCSKDCYSQWQKTALTGANGSGWKGGPRTLICKQCGKEFLNTEYRGATRAFCSRKCADEWRVGPNHPNWKGGPATVTCLNCGKEFLDTGFTHPRFCSKSCAFDYHGMTRNEEIIEEFLIAEEIPHVAQYGVPESHYVADFFIGPNLVIETDGAYWHSEERDAKRDAWLEDHGYGVMHIDYYEVLDGEDWQTLILDAISVGVL